ncbi:hypothetical protein BH24ACI4_BH24ACI4_26520 [soil metagenome]
MLRLLTAARLAATALAATVILLRGWVALTSGADINLVSGVWLALALDTHEGVFYRPLAEGGYYGGTRYFPLLFLLIAGGIRGGLDVLVAGQLASAMGGLLLVTGAFALLRRLSVGVGLAISGAVLALAPYFVLQSVFAIRTEPLAAGLALWGSACVAAGPQVPRLRARALFAALLFTLAAAAKPTALYAAVAAILALAAWGRQKDAARLGLLTAAGCGILLAVLSVSTDGRAMESFRAGALAGETPLALLRPLVRLDAVRLLFTSHYLGGVFLLVAAAILAAPRHVFSLPGLLVVLSSVASAVALATPGTILTNQAVEPYAAASVFLAWSAHASPRLRTAGSMAVTALLLWTSAHGIREVSLLLEANVRASAPQERAALQRAAEECRGTVLSESPLIPVLTGTRPILLDPFAFRVAGLIRPDIPADLITRLRAREFGCVLLEMDPESVRGQGWYANVHLGAPVIEALLDHYTLQRAIAGRGLYVADDR